LLDIFGEGEQMAIGVCQIFFFGGGGKDQKGGKCSGLSWLPAWYIVYIMFVILLI